MRTRLVEGRLARTAHLGLAANLFGVEVVVATRSPPLQGEAAVRIGLPPEPDVAGPIHAGPVLEILLPLVGRGLLLRAVPALVLATTEPSVFAGTPARAAALSSTTSRVRLERPSTHDATKPCGHAGRSPQALFSAQFEHPPNLDQRWSHVEDLPGGGTTVSQGLRQHVRRRRPPSTPPSPAGQVKPPPPARPRRGRERVFRLRLPPGWDRPEATGPGATAHAARGVPQPRSPAAPPGSPSTSPAASDAA